MNQKSAILYAMNVQGLSKRPENERAGTTSAWSSPEHILSLMRLISQRNFSKLANHPLADSRIILTRLGNSKRSGAHQETGAIIADFVTSLILQRLEELRSALQLSQMARAGVTAGKKRDISDNMTLGTSSGNKEFKRWSLLADHYLDKVSIKELSQYYSYSPRQVQYELRSARDELSGTLLRLERLASDTNIQKDIYISKGREGIWLSPSEKDSILSSMVTAYSAPCSAFLWGDWSVLISKKAIIVPVNKRVTVGFRPWVDDLECRIYEWSESEAAWVLNEWHSSKMKRVISESWFYLSSLEGVIKSDCCPIQVYIFSDVPCGCGIHERTAMNLCLAGCINSVFGLETCNEHRNEQIAAILESFWYPQVSWAPIKCSSRSPNSAKVMLFDRTADGGIDFQLVGRSDGKEIDRNRFLDSGAIKVDWIDFDVTKLVPLLHKAITTDINEVQRLYTQNLSLLRSIGFDCLSQLLINYIIDLNYEKVGMMMNLHHDILAACGFSSSSFDAVLKVLRSNPKILGVKPTCCLISGLALLALVDGSPPEATKDFASVVQPISSFVTPTAGLTEIL